MKTKIVYYLTSQIQYNRCPYCKKVVVMSDKKGVKALREWRKNKLKNHKK